MFDKPQQLTIKLFRLAQPVTGLDIAALEYKIIF